jgi:hypothetical protein
MSNLRRQLIFDEFNQNMKFILKNGYSERNPSGASELCSTKLKNEITSIARNMCASHITEINFDDIESSPVMEKKYLSIVEKALILETERNIRTGRIFVINRDIVSETIHKYTSDSEDFFSKLSYMPDFMGIPFFSRAIEDSEKEEEEGSGEWGFSVSSDFEKRLSIFTKDITDLLTFVEEKFYKENYICFYNPLDRKKEKIEKRRIFIKERSSCCLRSSDITSVIESFESIREDIKECNSLLKNKEFLESLACTEYEEFFSCQMDNLLHNDYWNNIFSSPNEIIKDVLSFFDSYKEEGNFSKSTGKNNILAEFMNIFRMCEYSFEPNFAEPQFHAILIENFGKKDCGIYKKMDMSDVSVFLDIEEIREDIYKKCLEKNNENIVIARSIAKKIGISKIKIRMSDEDSCEVHFCMKDKSVLATDEFSNKIRFLKDTVFNRNYNEFGKNLANIIFATKYSSIIDDGITTDFLYSFKDIIPNSSTMFLIENSLRSNFGSCFRINKERNYAFDYTSDEEIIFHAEAFGAASGYKITNIVDSLDDCLKNEKNECQKALSADPNYPSSGEPYIYNMISTVFDTGERLLDRIKKIDKCRSKISMFSRKVKELRSIISYYNLENKDCFVEYFLFELEKKCKEIDQSQDLVYQYLDERTFEISPSQKTFLALFEDKTKNRNPKKKQKDIVLLEDKTDQNNL